jgi:hypothetical protein
MDEFFSPHRNRAVYCAGDRHIQRVHSVTSKEVIGFNEVHSWMFFNEIYNCLALVEILKRFCGRNAQKQPGQLLFETPLLHCRR